MFFRWLNRRKAKREALWEQARNRPIPERWLAIKVGEHVRYRRFRGLALPVPSFRFTEGTGTVIKKTPLPFGRMAFRILPDDGKKYVVCYGDQVKVKHGEG